MTTEELFHFSSKLSHKKPNHIVSSSATSVLFSIQWNENTGTLFPSAFWSVVSTVSICHETEEGFVPILRMISFHSFIHFICFLKL